jgi:TolB-like protein
MLCFDYTQAMVKENKMNIRTKIIVVVAMLCFAGGCTMPVAVSKSLVNKPPMGEFNYRMENLAAQLDKNAINAGASNSYIITSFTNLDKLGDTTALGRLIAENLMHGLQLHKWQIYEVRLTKGIDINANGEFSLSRDINKLKDEYKISGIVTGTYSVAEGNLTINARVIDVNTGLLISSAQTYIPENMLPDAPSLNENGSKTMKIVSDGIK